MATYLEAFRLVLAVLLHQDQRVGVVAAGIGVPGVQLVEDLLRQIVAVLILPRIQADQQ